MGFLTSAYGCATVLGFVFLVLFVWEWRYDSYRYSNHDSIANLLLKLPDAPVSALLLWFTVSFFAGIWLPYYHDPSFSKWLGTRYGSLTSANYTILVPALVAAYVELLRQTREIVSKDNLSDLGIKISGWLVRPRTWKCLKVMLLLAIVLITKYAVANRIQETVSSPWTVDQERLSPAGVLYYLLRGVNGYLALGLFLSTIAIYSVFEFGVKKKDKSRMKLLHEGHQPKQLIRNLTATLAWCLFLSPVVVVLHGLALYWEMPKSEVDADRLGALAGSTWWLWAVMNVVSTCLLVVVIVRLHRCCGHELRRVESNLLNKMDLEIAATVAERQSVVEKCRARMEIVGRLQATSASPVAMSSLLLVVASILVQASGIIIQMLRVAIN